jgi:uncharacterized protein (PEP-CTERM system associated)
MGVALLACAFGIAAQPVPAPGGASAPVAAEGPVRTGDVRAPNPGPAAVVAAPEDRRTLLPEARIGVVATATSNGAGRPKGFEESDLLLSLSPNFRLTRRGPDFSLSAEAGADLFYSTGGTRRNRAFPTARVGATGTLVERLLFVDASLDVRQYELDPYSGRGDAGSTDNLRTSTVSRISPRIERELTPRVRLLAKAEDTLTRFAGNSASNLETRQGLIRLDGKPQPLGFNVELSRVDTLYDQTAIGGWTIDTLRAGLDYGFDDQFLVGVLGGVDRSNFALSSHTDSIAGLRMLWSPGPRTRLESTVERRFFGNAWNASFRHRMPWLAVAVRTVREPVTTTGGLGAATEGQNLTEFLDAILTTRFPDPIERAKLVESLITSRGLDSTLAGALNTLADYAQLRTGGDIGFVLLGPRDALSWSMYASSLRQLKRSDGQDILQGNFAADSRQYGTQLEYNRRLSPTASMVAAVRWSRIDGVGVRKNDSTSDTTYRLSWTQGLSPRSEFSLGAQIRRVRTNVNLGSSFDDSSLFTGLAHRF